MANIDISSKLNHEAQTITIAEGKTYEVDCSAKTMVKVQDMFKKDDSLEGLFKAIELLLGKEACKEIESMKVKVTDLKIIITAIMAQVNEISYGEMEKRFQEQQ